VIIPSGPRSKVLALGSPGTYTVILYEKDRVFDTGIIVHPQSSLSIIATDDKEYGTNPINYQFDAQLGDHKYPAERAPLGGPYLNLSAEQFPAMGPDGFHLQLEGGSTGSSYDRIALEVKVSDPVSPPSAPIPSAGNPTNYISSLDATVASVLFFESGFDTPPKQQRQYQTSFSIQTTRYISWELNLSYPAHNSERRIVIGL
jgi:hypothetical protein